VGGPSLPTAVVERGTFVDAVQIGADQSRPVHHDHRARRRGARITKLVRTGTLVKKGDA
jgi:hypothetical protein